MRSCCEEFKEILEDIEAVRTEAPSSLHERLNKIKAFVKAQWESHTDEAGETSWVGE